MNHQNNQSIKRTLLKIGRRESAPHVQTEMTSYRDTIYHIDGISQTGGESDSN